MPNQYPRYINRIKTSAKAIARIAIDLEKAGTRQLGSVNVNAYPDEPDPVIPEPVGSYCQVVTVAKCGGDFDVIQDAIDSITDAAAGNKYTLLIYPGVYTENVINADYISFHGMAGSRGQVEITAAAGTALTVATGSNSVYRNILIRATGTAEAVNIPVGMGTKWVQFWNCSIEGVYGAHNDDLITMNSGHLQIINSVVRYLATGGAGTHRILNIIGASTQLYIVSCLWTMDIDDIGANDVTAIELAAGANCNVIIAQNAAEFDLETTATNTFYKDMDTIGAVEREIYNNHIHIKGAAGATSYIFYLDNVATELETVSNTLIAEGHNFNYAAYIGAAATWDTSFDANHVDPEIYAGTGTINYVHTDIPGELHVENIHLSETIHANGIFTTLTPLDTVTIFDVVAQLTGSTGGDIHVLDVAIGGAGSAVIAAVGTHTDVDVIHQHIGTFQACDKAWKFNGGFTDVTAEFGNPANDVAIFDNDNDYIYIGDGATFDEVDVILDTPSSHNIFQTTPTFEYWNGAAWTPFSPIDNTNGFRQNGSISFEADNLTGWALSVVNGSNQYWIRIQRTRNHISTIPIEDTIKVLSTTFYYWDKDGIISCSGLYVHVNGELRFYDNGNYVGFEAPALAADQIWVLPNADGNADDVLKTDGAGNLGWTAGTVGSGVSKTASFTLVVNDYIVIDCGAIADDAIDHVCWAVVSTLDGVYHAENRPRSPQLGGVSFMWYKDSGNLKVKVWNDSGSDKTVRAFYT